MMEMTCINRYTHKTSHYIEWTKLLIETAIESKIQNTETSFSFFFWGRTTMSTTAFTFVAFSQHFCFHCRLENVCIHMIAVCFWHRENLLLHRDSLFSKHYWELLLQWHWIVAFIFFFGGFSFFFDGLRIDILTTKINICWLLFFLKIFSFKCTHSACSLLKNTRFWCLDFDLTANRIGKMSTSMIHCQQNHFFFAQASVAFQNCVADRIFNLKKNRYSSNETSSIFEC